MSKPRSERFHFFHEPINELFFHESDRGCVLVGASMIDEQLTLTLKALFSQEQRVLKQTIGNLFRGNGPLSSYWSKLHVLNALGYLSSEDFHDLYTIRELRNAVAHGGIPFDFENADVTDQVGSLNCWRRHSTGSRVEPPPDWVMEEKRKRNKAKNAGTRLLTEAKLIESGIWKTAKLGFASTVWELLNALKELPNSRKPRRHLRILGK